MTRIDFIEPLVREDDEPEAEAGTFDLVSGSSRFQGGQSLMRIPHAEHFGRQPLTSAWDDTSARSTVAKRKPVGPSRAAPPPNPDRQWILEHLFELGQQYPGEFIAVLNKRVIGHHSNGLMLRKTVSEEQHEGEPILWRLGVLHHARRED